MGAVTGANQPQNRELTVIGSLEAKKFVVGEGVTKKVLTVVNANFFGWLFGTQHRLRVVDKATGQERHIYVDAKVSKDLLAKSGIAYSWNSVGRQIAALLAGVKDQSSKDGQKLSPDKYAHKLESVPQHSFRAFDTMDSFTPREEDKNRLEKDFGLTWPKKWEINKEIKSGDRDGFLNDLLDANFKEQYQPLKIPRNITQEESAFVKAWAEMFEKKTKTKENSIGGLTENISPGSQSGGVTPSLSYKGPIGKYKAESDVEFHETRDTEPRKGSRSNTDVPRTEFRGLRKIDLEGDPVGGWVDYFKGQPQPKDLGRQGYAIQQYVKACLAGKMNPEELTQSPQGVNFKAEVLKALVVFTDHERLAEDTLGKRLRALANFCAKP